MINSVNYENYRTGRRDRPNGQTLLFLYINDMLPTNKLQKLCVS